MSKNTIRAAVCVILPCTLCVFSAARAQTRPETDFLKSMRESMQRMHAQMMTAQTSGDPDHDFASLMISHHQGGIDMAKAELLYGKDPVMRRLAQEIVADQQSEIEAMNLWLEKSARRRGNQ